MGFVDYLLIRRHGIGKKKRVRICAHMFVCVRKGRGKEGDCSGFDGVRSVWMFALGMTFGLT